MTTLNEERVLSVHHWNESLFSFTTTRNTTFRFRHGHFVMMGIEIDQRPLLRAFSLVGANYDEHLEFYSIKIPGGALTSRLRHVAPGHRVLVSKKPTGTLLVENVRPGKRLYLLATGTGLAPFMSIVRDPATYERFEHVVVVHGVRRVSDLGYRAHLENGLFEHELIGAQAREKLRYYPTVTRESFIHRGRVSHLLESGKLAGDLGFPREDAACDRFMLCGSPAMLKDVASILESRGFEEGRGGSPATYVVERAFVER
ncbi:MAG TPA: ferredoxin--NADP reductase [Polyangiaceae bacterium]|nr:ferredoxin--NADP reductase [Polyangiaceae bacterium]